VHISAKWNNLNITTTTKYYYIATMRQSGTVMEIWHRKDMYTDSHTHT